MNDPIAYIPVPVPGLSALACANGHPFDAHIHDGHVIWMNSLGGEHYTLKGTSGILQPGEIGIIEPGIVHANHPCKGTGRYLRSLYLEERFWDYLAQMSGGQGGRCPGLSTVMFRDQRSWQQLLGLHQAIVAGEDVWEVEERVLALFPGMCARFAKGSVPAARRQSGQERVTNRLQDYMRANLKGSLSLQDLAAVAGCTPFHLIRMFKAHVGMSPHVYLTHLRLEEARRLLDRHAAIADAAIQAGFADQSHLTRRFKQRYGVTPGRYLVSIR